MQNVSGGGSDLLDVFQSDTLFFAFNLIHLSIVYIFLMSKEALRFFASTVQLQHHARHRLPTYRLIFVHVIESLVFVPVRMNPPALFVPAIECGGLLFCFVSVEVSLRPIGYCEPLYWGRNCVCAYCHDRMFTKSASAVLCVWK